MFLGSPFLKIGTTLAVLKQVRFAGYPVSGTPLVYAIGYQRTGGILLAKFR